jgi:hypothetical protein
MAIETPKFTVLQKDGKFEIRQYEGYLSASVEVEADYNHALGEGFGILADYIFGNNRAKTGIAMTAPVTEQAVKSQKIEMTAPVTAKKVGEGSRHLISFTMPAKYTLESLPEPVNKAISVRRVEPYKAAVLKFSGYMNEKTTAKKIQELQIWLKANKLEAKSGFITAQYNPPWIPGPFRRNEISAEV